VYDLEAVRLAAYVNVDLGLTSEQVATLSPARMPQAHAAPFITAVGGLESDEFKRQNALIGTRWKPNRRADLALPDTNHLTICNAFANPGSPLHAATLALVAALD
jgi:arylformamidase